MAGVSAKVLEMPGGQSLAVSAGRMGPGWSSTDIRRAKESGFCVFWKRRRNVDFGLGRRDMCRCATIK